MSYQNSNAPYTGLTMNNQAESRPWYTNFKTWLKILILVSVVTFIVLAIVYNKTSSKVLKDFLAWMKDNPFIGAFAFIGIYWICTVTFIPGSLLTLGAGFVFRAVAGPWAGIFLATVIVFVGACLGASSAFLLGRFVFRDQVEGVKAKYTKFEIVDQVVMEEGLQVTLLLRLSPIIPFNAFNYIMGLTGVRFRDYNLAHFGMIPGTLAYCFIGGSLGAIGDSVGLSNPTVLIVTVAGTVIAIAGMIYVSIVAKKKFNKIAERHKQQSEESVRLADDSQSMPQEGVCVA